MYHYNNKDETAFDYEYGRSKVRINIYLKEGQLIKANGEDNRYYENHLENGVKVYQFIDDDLQLVNTTL